MILLDTWGSIVKLTREIVTEMRVLYPDVAIEFIDWEAHANLHELPDTDLIGPTALSIEEEEPELFRANFSIGVSTYQTDTNLFRFREYLDHIFDRVRFGKKLPLYETKTSALRGQYYFTEGTLLSPMSRAEVRPFQFVQTEALLEPSSKS